MDLRDSTTVTIKLGPFVSQTDGYTVKTALTPVVKLSKNGGTKAVRSSATAITHDSDGDYSVELNATDTNTRGTLRLSVSDPANHLPVWLEFSVLAAAYWDEKYGGTVALTAATATTATLDAGASATDSYYTAQLLVITGGAGAGQTRRITGYVGATKVATVDTAWTTNPASGSTFRIVANSPTVLSSTDQNAVADAYLDRVNGIETGLTPRNALRLTVAASAGKVSGATSGAGTVTIRNAVADTKNRIQAVTDVFANRTAVTVDLT